MKEFKINIQDKEIIIFQDDDGFFIKPKIVIELEKQGTATKPAHEPICMARKPLSEKTVAENCLKWGTGGINIDESRVDGKTEIHSNGKRSMYGGNSLLESKTHNDKTEVKDYGRFPANLIHDNSEEVRECFPETGKSKRVEVSNKGSIWGSENENKEVRGHDDNGGNASRFFKSIIYQAKASKSERNSGMDNIEAKEWKQENSPNPNRKERPFLPVKNNHPTVKPIALMEYLIKMVTPKGGIVLDPFAGSGTTLIGAKLEGYNFIGIEMEPEYIKIARARLEAYK